MRVKIVAPPIGEIDGFRVDQMRVGRIYNLPTTVASVLIVEGYAQLEMRTAHRRKRQRPLADSDRRKPTRLFIVSRGEEQTFRLLEQNLGRDPSVRIIWDRRYEDRRIGNKAVQKERRRAERRRPQVWSSTKYIVVDISP